MRNFSGRMATATLSPDFTAAGLVARNGPALVVTVTLETQGAVVAEHIQSSTVFTDLGVLVGKLIMVA